MRRSLPLLILLGACASESASLRAAPCFARHRTIPLDEVTDVGLSPRDAVGRYSTTVEDDQGSLDTIDVRLRRPVVGWVREVVREPARGFTETTSCDVRVGVELDVLVETGDRLFVEEFQAAAVRTAFHDHWMLRLLRPLDALEGEWPETRTEGCDDVDVGFDLSLEDNAVGGRIVERLPGTREDVDPCFREVARWDP